MAAGGYHGRALRIDVATGFATSIPLDDGVLRRFVGGSGLGTWLLSRESPAELAAAATMKHQASDPISTSSGTFATDRNSRGNTVLLMMRLKEMSTTPRTIDSSRGRISGFSRFG